MPMRSGRSVGCSHVGKRILDTCAGLGYFAAWCLQGGATEVLSYEKNPDVLWLRGLNPWSPPPGNVLKLTLGDITEQILRLPDASMDAILHDPPRFGIAGELYSLELYEQMARVLQAQGPVVPLHRNAKQAHAAAGTCQRGCDATAARRICCRGPRRRGVGYEEMTRPPIRWTHASRPAWRGARNSPNGL